MTAKDGTSYGGASGLELDPESAEIRFVDRAGRDVELALGEVEEIAVERAVHEMNPAQQTAAWKIETAMEPVDVTVPVAELSIGGDAVALGEPAECDLFGPRLLEVDRIAFDEAAGTFHLTGSVVTYEKVFFGGPAGDATGMGKN